MATLFIIIVLCLLLMTVSSADSTTSPWLTTTNPVLTKLFDLSAADQLPPTVAGLGNRDCVNQPVVSRPAKVLQTQQIIDGCFVPTGFGVADSNGWIRFSGATVAGASVNFGPYSPGIIPIPASLDVFHYTGAGANGLYLHLTRNLPQPIGVETALDGKVTYRFTRAADGSVRDKSGVLLPAHTDSLSFSTNGKWAVVDSPNRAMLRINLETLEVLPFAPAFNYSLGVSPGVQTAVSNDGRYAIVASRTFGVLKLYDLASCGAVPTSINAPVSCASKDLLPYFQNQLPGFYGVHTVRFVSGEVIKLYGLASSGGVITRAKYALAAPGTDLTHPNYLALGDSFSSGEGDNQGGVFYEPATNNPTNKCHVSRRSYPYLIAAAISLNDFHDVTCSGAVISNISRDISYPSSTTSLAFSDWTPGYQPQKNYIITPPAFLTISIGGNDIGFGSIMAECATSHYKIPLPTTCPQAGDPVERANAAKLIADQFPRLIQTYKELVAATDQKTKIYVVGYPKFVKGSGGSCGLNVRLNDQERELVDRGVSYLNQVIKAAAENVGIHYLDIENALENRNLCSIVADDQMAVNGLTEGDDKRLPWWAAYLVDGVTGVGGLGSLGIANASYHPNAIGQRLMYEKILALTNGDPSSFSICPTNQVLCPTATPIPMPDSSYFGQEAYDYAAKYKGVPLPYPISGPSAPARIITTPSSTSNTIRAKLDYLMPNTVASLSLDRVELKRVNTGQQTQLQEDIIVPTNTSPGLHRLEVRATNIAGEQITVNETIFVPGPEGDINGNHVPDHQEACGFTPASGQDSDNDGIDDACDGSLTPSLPFLTISVRKLYAR
ncbi:MAG: SGNH/GDSL hydrolase family protein [Candidatus Saccharibacteria bacterium]|nr:SGNH/GDSL hydrolase family protein [Candidatus Saccharibacteria bacterium]